MISLKYQGMASMLMPCAKPEMALASNRILYALLFLSVFEVLRDRLYQVNVRRLVVNKKGGHGNTLLFNHKEFFIYAIKCDVFELVRHRIRERNTYRR